MKKKGIISTIMNFGADHKREIMFAAEVTGVIMTGVLAYKAGKKAEPIISKHKKILSELDKSDAEAVKNETVEIIKDFAPVFVPPVATALATVGVRFADYKDVSKRIALLTTAYNLTEKSFEDFKESATELIGPRKTEELKDAVNNKVIKKAAETLTEDEIINTGHGNVLFYDKYVTGRFFRSSFEDIKTVINDINSDINDGAYDGDLDKGFVPYNDILDRIGLPSDTVAGESLGFPVDMLNRGSSLIDLRGTSARLESKIFEPTGESATVIDYFNPPRFVLD